jgi:hypothetical protein
MCRLHSWYYVQRYDGGRDNELHNELQKGAEVGSLTTLHVTALSCMRIKDNRTLAVQAVRAFVQVITSVSWGI